LDLQSSLGSPAGVVLMSLFAALFATALMRWSRGDRERQLALGSAGAGTALTLVLLIVIHRDRWLGGTAFRAPLALQLFVYAPHIYAAALLPLALYRLLARWPVVALGAYFAWIALFSWATVPVERGFVANGVYAFQADYTMREDVLWG